jgi:hypothetical protein
MLARLGPLQELKLTDPVPTDEDSEDFGGPPPLVQDLARCQLFALFLAPFPATCLGLPHSEFLCFPPGKQRLRTDFSSSEEPV